MEQVAATFDRRQRRLAQLLACAGLAAILLLELALILRANQGQIVYTLDDAYIQLSMAEGIRAGTYGINPGEPAAASSSILYPFLLAPLAVGDLGDWAPFLVNSVAAFATVLALVDFLFLVLPFARQRQAGWTIAALVLILVPTFNVAGLVFSGMEHACQLWLTVLAMLGTVRFLRRGHLATWLPPVLVLGPLVRYENLSLTLPLLVLLGVLGRLRSALVGAAAVALTLGAFTAFLFGQGLGPLPASVMLKAPIAEAEAETVDVAVTVVKNLRKHLYRREGAMMALGALACLGVALGRGVLLGDRLLAAGLAAAATAQLSLGRFDGYRRYELYIWSALVLGALYLWRRHWPGWWQGQRLARALVALAAVAAVAAMPYFLALHTIPMASSNIYSQQYQLRRLAVEHYRRPVAVNDIGWVSYRNDLYVLDLWGLASPEAGEFRAERTDEGGWMDDLAARHGVDLILLYERWFPPAPDGWTKVGELHLTGKLITPADSKVAIFVRRPGALPAVLAALRGFEQDLPAGARLEYAPDA